MKALNHRIFLVIVISFLFKFMYLIPGNKVFQSNIENPIPYDSAISHGGGQKTSIIDPDAFLRLIGGIARYIKYLDYDYTTEFRIPIPRTNQELVYNWGFAGSGDIFTPLTSVKPTFRRSVSGGMNQDGFAFELGMAIFEDHSHEIGEMVPFLNSLLDSKLSAKMIFSIKLILLLKKFRSIGIEKIQADIVRLFIRLAQSEEFLNLGADQTLESYLPPIIIRLLESTSPTLLIFANNVFDAISNRGSINKLLEAGEKIYFVSGFVFNDRGAADRFFSEAKDTKDSNFFNAVRSAIKKSDYEQNGYDTFINFKSSPDYIKKKLFAFRDFGPLQTAQLPVSLKKAVDNVANYPSLLRVDDGDDYWILFITDKFGFSQTLNILLSSIVQTFNDYKNARCNYFKLNSHEDAKLRRILNEQQRNIAKIEKFLASKQGQESKQRVDEAIKKINMEFIKRSKLSVLKSDLEKLEDEKEELEKQIRIKTSSVNDRKEEDDHDVGLLKNEVLEIVQLKSKLEQIKKQIEEISNSQENSKSNILNNIEESSDELIRNLNELELLAAQKRASGENIDSKLDNAILSLKRKIDQLAGYDDTVLSFEDKLEKREMLAGVYSKEAYFLESELRKKQSEIDSIFDSEKKTIANLLFSSKKEQYEMKISSLRDEARKILDENKSAKELHLLREMLISSDITISDDQKEKINKLESSVGYILDGKQCTSSIMHYIQKNKEMNEFVTLTNSKIPEYKGIRDAFLNRLKFLVNNSEAISKNKATIDLLIRRVLPEIQISLRNLSFYS